MTYSVSILRRAQKELSALAGDTYPRVCEGIRALAQEPRPTGCLKLSGRNGWRIRIGDHRVIYEINDAARTISVLHVGHRRDVYR